ncbi:MAG: hypothetical protein LBT70_01760 [Holosporaceae bacterium]|jgi:hypothetical protein|nr:hypothetical protein [Holosporaceae bacterium]
MELKMIKSGTLFAAFLFFGDLCSMGGCAYSSDISDSDKYLCGSPHFWCGDKNFSQNSVGCGSYSVIGVCPTRKCNLPIDSQIVSPEAKTFCFPKFTNSLEEIIACWEGFIGLQKFGSDNLRFGVDSQEAWKDRIEKSGISSRVFLNEDCSWTIREESPAARPVIKGMWPEEGADSTALLPPPDVIVIPNIGTPATNLAGYPMEVSCANFSYCPPENETPEGYNLRCFLIRKTDVETPHPSMNRRIMCSMGIRRSGTMFHFGFLYVRQGIAGADQDDIYTRETLDRVRTYKEDEEKEKNRMEEHWLNISE